MADLSRSQLLVYGAVAAALLLIGARAIRSGDEGAVASSPPSGGSTAVTVEGGADLVVDVAGAVRRPGVYRLPGGSRVVDALRRAGGASRDAELTGLNRAARLTDGQQVVVPARGAVADAGAAAEAPAGPIGLGAATVADLETIDGIGPVTAQKIIEFRDANGGLASVEQLDEVSGIGPATMESLRDRLQP